MTRTEPDTPSEKAEARPTAEQMALLRGVAGRLGEKAPAIRAALDYIESMESIATDISEERDQAVARIRDLQAQEARLREALRGLTRYDCEEGPSGPGNTGWGPPTMEEFSEGEYVRWADVDAALSTSPDTETRDG